jgi:hypothetical protein
MLMLLLLLLLWCCCCLALCWHIAGSLLFPLLVLLLPIRPIPHGHTPW